MKPEDSRKSVPIMNDDKNLIRNLILYKRENKLKL